MINYLTNSRVTNLQFFGKFEEDPIPVDCVKDDKYFNSLALQLNRVYDVDADFKTDLEAIINHHFITGALEL